MESGIGKTSDGLGAAAAGRSGSAASRPASTFAPQEPLSPGAAGSVFNPIVWAEFRRWRARPVTYLGFALFVFLLIVVDHKKPSLVMDLLGSTGLLQTGPGASRWVLAVQSVKDLIIRPSTVLPLLMTWRALRTFRKEKMYKPFRTTFLTPTGFLWGVICIPFLLSALFIIAYTGWVLGPGIISAASRMPPGTPMLHPYWTMMGVIFEGSMNGAAICFVALYFGIRSNARLSALLPVIAFTFLIQSAHSLTYVFSMEISSFFTRLPMQTIGLLQDGLQRAARAGLPLPAGGYAFLLIWIERGFFLVEKTWLFAVPGVFKLLVCMVFWALTKAQMMKDVLEEL